MSFRLPITVLGDGEMRTHNTTIRQLQPDADWTDAPELGMLAEVINQDAVNMPDVQKGLKTL